ncbi:hypothetical protein RJ641_030047 [Dillenia turbinata]|uniref:Uncharacterized protein n=1 Tax=Dillenia turbinata TaxID=194707 RepID=A0AAN8ZJU5_9MAGN
MRQEKKKTVKLYCPSLSKIIPITASEDQKLDLGSIARGFGLDPATLKLNGHFISRGIDLISSSVTWKSLLSFFSSRGLSTGSDGSDPLIVDGKLCKSGTKRTLDTCLQDEHVQTTVSKTSPTEEVNLVKKLRDNSSAFEDVGTPIARFNLFSLKRKQQHADVDPLKRPRFKENNSGRVHNIHLGSHSRFSCSYINHNLKRMREDGIILTAPCKRTR